MARVRVWLALLAAAVAGAGMGAVLSLSLPDAGAIDTVSMEQTVVGEPVLDPDDPVPSPEVSDHEHVAHQTTSAEPSPEATPAPPPPPADVEQDQAETSSDRPPPGAPSPSGPLGIPERLLLAYRAAAAGYGQWCGLSWQVVAAVGQVESGHARGGQVYPDGQTWEPILGPVLDGSGFAAIPDSDDGVLDGDPVWDRAVGPMQFLPRTWAWLGADADRDGRADPHDVDDAAATTARYLCSHGGDLSDVGQLRSALLRYNASAAYVDTVLAWAEAYGDRAVATADPEPPAEPTPTPTATPTPSPSPTPTEEPTPTPSPSPTPTEEPTPTPTEEPTPAPTEEPTPAPTLEATSMTGSTSTPG